jgi:hypothetical protein
VAHFSFKLSAVLLCIAVLAFGSVNARPVVTSGTPPPHSGRADLNDADPDATPSLISHDIGNVRMALSN